MHAPKTMDLTVLWHQMIFEHWLLCTEIWPHVIFSVFYTDDFSMMLRFQKHFNLLWKNSFVWIHSSNGIAFSKWTHSMECNLHAIWYEDALRKLKHYNWDGKHLNNLVIIIRTMFKLSCLTAYKMIQYWAHKVTFQLATIRTKLSPIKFAEWWNVFSSVSFDGLFSVL